MSEQAFNIEKGYLVTPEDEADENKRIKLHFNPNSLSYSVEASAQQGNQPNRTGQVQYAAQYSARLSFDTFFDNTDTGEDVRLTTDRIAQMLQPAPAASGGATQTRGVAAPPLVVFHWGAFRFTGVLTQYKETIEFFAKEGVPLRSAVSLTLLKQDKTLERDASVKANTGGALVPTSGSDSALSAATRGGDPRAARGLAGANGLESLRFTGGATLEVGAGLQASAGVGASGGGAFSASSKWDASGSGGLFSARASAGVSASAGAFAGVGVSARGGGSLDSSRMLSSTVGADVSTHASASFSLGGAAQSEAGVGLTADVGARASWKQLVRFHDDEG